jgi:hypothetical protein
MWSFMHSLALQTDTLRINANLWAEIQTKQQQPNSHQKDVVVIIKGCEGRDTAPLEVGIDFNLVTLVDDALKFAENTLAWSIGFTDAMKEEPEKDPSARSSKMRHAATAAAAATAATATAIHLHRAAATNWDKAAGLKHIPHVDDVLFASSTSASTASASTASTNGQVASTNGRGESAPASGRLIPHRVGRLARVRALKHSSTS